MSTYLGGSLLPACSPPYGQYSQGALLKLDLLISYPEPIGNLAITSLWVQGEEGVVRDAVGIHLSKSFGKHNTFEIDARFSATGLRAVGMSIGVSWSLYPPNLNGGD